MKMKSDPRPNEFIPTRKSLLNRLKNFDDSISWGDFFNTYWRLIYSVAIKSGLSEIEAQEVVQETVIAISKKIPEFTYDPAQGSFKAWLLNQTRWRIQDQFRKRKREAKAIKPLTDTQSPGAPIDRLADPSGPDLEAIWDHEWQENLIQTAIEKVKPQVNPKQFQIFDLYVNKAWSVGRIQKALGVTASQIYLAKHRISALIKKEIQNVETRLQ